MSSYVDGINEYESEIHNAIESELTWLRDGRREWIKDRLSEYKKKLQENASLKSDQNFTKAQKGV